MGKIDSSYQARLDGMAFALKVAEKDGIEGLRKEVKFRNANFMPLEISTEGKREICSWVTARVVQTFLTMVLATLRDTEKWGEKRLKRFQAAFEEKCEGVDALDPDGEHYARISDYAEMLKKECNICMDLDVIFKVQQDTDNDRRKKHG